MVPCAQVLHIVLRLLVLRSKVAVLGAIGANSIGLSYSSWDSLWVGLLRDRAGDVHGTGSLGQPTAGNVVDVYVSEMLGVRLDRH